MRPACCGKRDFSLHSGAGVSSRGHQSNSLFKVELPLGVYFIQPCGGSGWPRSVMFRSSSSCWPGLCSARCWALWPMRPSWTWWCRCGIFSARSFSSWCRWSLWASLPRPLCAWGRTPARSWWWPSAWPTPPHWARPCFPWARATWSFRTCPSPRKRRPCASCRKWSSAWTFRRCSAS